MNCTKCGNSLRPNAKFCASCGHAVATSSISPPSSVQLPPLQHGGYASPVGQQGPASPHGYGPTQSQYTPTPIEPHEQPAATGMYNQAADRQRRLLMVGIIVLSLILVGVIIFLAITYLGGDNPDAVDGGMVDGGMTESTPPSEAATEEVSSEPTAVPLTPEPGTELDAESGTTGNLVLNGDFRQPWDAGWTRAFAEGSNGASAETAVEPSEQMVSGQAVKIRRPGTGHLALKQMIPIELGEAQFSAQVKLQGVPPNDSGAESVGVLMLAYYGEAPDVPIGWSLWMNGLERDVSLMGQGLLPPSGPNVSQNFVGDDWATVDIDVRREILDRLPAIQVDAIRQVEVILLAQGSDTCGSTECPVEILAGDFSLLKK